jgi:hypothetical protein
MEIGSITTFEDDALATPRKENTLLYVSLFFYLLAHLSDNLILVSFLF